MPIRGKHHAGGQKDLENTQKRNMSIGEERGSPDAVPLDAGKAGCRVRKKRSTMLLTHGQNVMQRTIRVNTNTEVCIMLAKLLRRNAQAVAFSISVCTGVIGGSALGTALVSRTWADYAQTLFIAGVGATSTLVLYEIATFLFGVKPSPLHRLVARLFRRSHAGKAGE